MATVWQYLLHPSIGQVNALLAWRHRGPNWLGSSAWVLPEPGADRRLAVVGFNMVLFRPGCRASRAISMPPPRWTARPRPAAASRSSPGPARADHALRRHHSQRQRGEGVRDRQDAHEGGPNRERGPPFLGSTRGLRLSARRLRLGHDGGLPPRPRRAHAAPAPGARPEGPLLMRAARLSSRKLSPARPSCACRCWESGAFVMLAPYPLMLSVAAKGQARSSPPRSRSGRASSISSRISPRPSPACPWAGCSSTASSSAA